MWDERIPKRRPDALESRLCAIRFTEFETHGRESTAMESELACCGFAHVDDAMAGEGAAIVDAHIDRATIVDIDDAHTRTEGQGAMCRGEILRPEDLAGSRAPAGELPPVPRSHPALDRLALRRCRSLHFAFWRCRSLRFALRRRRSHRLTLRRRRLNRLALRRHRLNRIASATTAARPEREQRHGRGGSSEQNASLHPERETHPHLLERQRIGVGLQLPGRHALHQLTIAQQVASENGNDTSRRDGSRCTAPSHVGPFTGRRRAATPPPEIAPTWCVLHREPDHTSTSGRGTVRMKPCCRSD